jgi:tetratricopeptide (TPR) repeat protein
MKLRLAALVLAFAAVVPAGCSGGGLKQYIVSLRNHQGDLGLQRGSYQDASLSFRLALQLDPNDAHARSGLAQVQLKIAQQQYQASKFEDALGSIAIATKYDPQSVRIAELRAEIEQARIKREIVISNYPTYAENGRQIQRSYRELRTLDAKIIVALQRFDYTFDSAQLMQAIQNSYVLGEEVQKNTSRLVAFRQLVEAGVPNARANQPLVPAASLLPLP